MATPASPWAAGYSPVDALWIDRSFHQLAIDQRAQKMASMDPEFAALPSSSQFDLLLKAYEKYYVNRLPPPSPASIALAEQGLQDPGVAMPDPQRTHSELPPPTDIDERADLEQAKKRARMPGARQAAPAAPPPPPVPAPGTSLPGGHVTGAAPPVAIPPPTGGAGLLKPGNIDLAHRPVVQNADGTTSTVRSISVGFPEGEVLIPTVTDDGRVVSNEEAIDLYRRTGKHLGIFSSPEAATAAAEQIHKDQETLYAQPGAAPARPGPEILAEEQPPEHQFQPALLPKTPTAAPIFARKSGRVVTTPQGKTIPLPSQYDYLQPSPQPTIRKPPQVEVERDTGYNPNASPLDRAIQNSVGALGRGAIDFVGQMVGGGAQIAGHVTGSDRLGQFGRDVSSATHGLTDVTGFRPEDENLDNPEYVASLVFAGLGSTIPIMATGVGMSASLARLIKAGRIPASWGGISRVAGGMEGMQAGANAYDEAIREGKSPRDAMIAAVLVGTSTSIISTKALADFEDEGLALGQKLLRVPPKEALQEGFQQETENIAQGNPVGQGTGTAMAIGGLVGGMATLGMHQRTPGPPPPVPGGPPPPTYPQNAPGYQPPTPPRDFIPTPPVQPPPPVQNQPRPPLQDFPETGIPEDVARGVAKREDLALKMYGKPWGELKPPERLAIDDLAVAGYTGATAPAPPEKVKDIWPPGPGPGQPGYAWTGPPTPNAPTAPPPSAPIGAPPAPAQTAPPEPAPPVPAPVPPPAPAVPPSSAAPELAQHVLGKPWEVLTPAEQNGINQIAQGLLSEVMGATEAKQPPATLPEVQARLQQLVQDPSQFTPDEFRSLLAQQQALQSGQPLPAAQDPQAAMLERSGLRVPPPVVPGVRFQEPAPGQPEEAEAPALRERQSSEAMAQERYGMSYQDLPAPAREAIDRDFVMARWTWDNTARPTPAAPSTPVVPPATKVAPPAPVAPPKLAPPPGARRPTTPPVAAAAPAPGEQTFPDLASATKSLTGQPAQTFHVTTPSGRSTAYQWDGKRTVWQAPAGAPAAPPAPLPGARATPAPATTPVAAAPTPTPAPPAPALPGQRQSPATMTRAQWRSSPNATGVPKGSVLAINLDKETPKSLEANWTSNQLKDLAMIAGSSKSGSKSELVKRILKVWGLRGKLSTYSSDAAGIEELAKLPGKDLKEMTRALSLSQFGNKKNQATTLIKWRDKVRSEGKLAIADANWGISVEAALKKGVALSPEVEADARKHLPWLFQTAEESEAQAAKEDAEAADVEAVIDAAERDAEVPAPAPPGARIQPTPPSATFPAPNLLPSGAMTVAQAAQPVQAKKAPIMAKKKAAPAAPSSELEALLGNVPTKGTLEKIAEKGEEAAKRLREKGITTGENLGAHNFADPEVIRDFSYTIAGDVARGAITFRDWSRNMVDVYGDVVKPALDAIWDAASNAVLPEGYKMYRPGMKLSELSPSMIPKTTEKRKKQIDVISYLDMQIRNQLGTIPATAAEEEKLNRLRQLAFPEFDDQMSVDPDVSLFYSEDTVLTDRRLELAFPELKNKPKLHVFLKAISAALANDATPRQEAKYGAFVYDTFRREGKIPLKQPGGKNWPGQGALGQLTKLQQMVDHFGGGMKGAEAVGQYMISVHTVAENRRFRPTHPGKATDRVYGSLVLGPKLGVYFLDLNGVVQDDTTIDRWEARASSRRLGRLMIPVPVDKLHPTGRGPTEVPTPESERKIFQRIHHELAAKANLPLPSAAQSVTWHYEQALYRALGLDVKSLARSAGVAEYLQAKKIPYDPSKRELQAAERAANHGRVVGGRETPGSGSAGKGNVRGAGQAGLGAAAKGASAAPAAAPSVPSKRGVVGARRKRDPGQAGFLGLGGKPATSPKFTFLDKTVQENFEAAGAPPGLPGPLESLNEWLKDIYHGLSRTYEELDPDEDGPLIYQFKQAEKAPSISETRAKNYLKRINSDLDANQHDVLRYKIVADDLQETYNKWKAEGKLPPGADDALKLAFGFTPKMLRDEIPRLDAHIAADPKLQDALKEYEAAFKEVEKEFVPAMVAAGDKDAADIFKRLKYYRHRVLDYIVANQGKGPAPGGGKPRVPAGQSYSKARGPEARELPYSTDIITSTFEVLSQLIGDTKKAKLMSWLGDPKNGYNILADLKKKAAAKTAAAKAINANAEEITWEDEIPDTHEHWQPGKSHIFYSAHTIPERIAQDLIANINLWTKINESDLREGLMLGGKREGFVLPKRVVQTLEHGLSQPLPGRAQRAIQKIMGLWKQQMLGWITTAPHYFARNAISDLDKSLHNPGSYKKSGKAVKDLTAYATSLYKGKPEMSADLRDWFDHGGFSSTQQKSELGELRHDQHLDRLLKELEKKQPRGPLGARKVAEKGLEFAMLPLKKWFEAARIGNDGREAIMRYANFLSYKEQAESGDLDNYGASNPKTIDALDTPSDKAWKLSNDLINPYDEVSAYGQKLRAWGFPFWSFTELNTRSHVGLYKNAALIDKKLAIKVGNRIIGARSRYMAFRVGIMAFKMFAYWGAAQALNHWLFPDEEKNLRKEVRRRAHHILAKRDDGSVILFPNTGNLQEFLNWLDPEDAVALMRDVINQKKDPFSAFAEWAWNAPIEKLIQGLGPFPKNLMDLAYRKTAFPSLEHPRNIYDRGEYLASSLGFGEMYKAAFGLPRRRPSLDQRLLNWLAYTSDPKESADADIRDLVDKYREERGEGGKGGGRTSLRANALRHIRNSLRWRDHEAFVKFATDYAEAGGTSQNLQQSLDMLHPLAGLDEAEQTDFIESLSEDDQDRLILAVEYWEETMSPARLEEFLAEATEKSAAAAGGK